VTGNAVHRRIDAVSVDASSSARSPTIVDPAETGGVLAADDSSPTGAPA